MLYVYEFPLNVSANVVTRIYCVGSKKLNKMGIVAFSSGEESSRTWTYQNTTLHWWKQHEWHIH